MCVILYLLLVLLIDIFFKLRRANYSRVRGSANDNYMYTSKRVIISSAYHSVSRKLYLGRFITSFHLTCAVSALLPPLSLWR